MSADPEAVLGASVLVTLAESTKILRRSESGVRALVREGRLPVIRFSDRPGARLYFDLRDLQNFIAAHKTSAR